MAERRDTVIGVVWLLVVAALAVALVAGIVKVASEPTAENAYRWILALFFLAGPLALITLRYQHVLRRLLKR